MRLLPTSNLLGILILAAVILVGTSGGSSCLADDLDALQGVWKVERHEWLGRPEGSRVQEEWVVKGDQLAESRSSVTRGKISLEQVQGAGKFLRTIDDREAFKHEGLYKLTTDTFKTWFGGLPTQEPLKDIPDDDDRRYSSETWTRIGKANGKGLDGVWRLTGRRIAATNVSLEHLEDEMRVEGDRYVRNSKSIQMLMLKLNPEETPKSIDMTFSAPAHLVGDTVPGIYRLEGDRLSVCSDVKRTTRPTPFGSSKEPGDSRALFELKRIMP